MATRTMTVTEASASTETPSSRQRDAQPVESYELTLTSPKTIIKSISQRFVKGSKRRSPSDSGEDSDDVRADMPQPATAQVAIQKWNSPRGNIGRLGFAFLSFMIAGLNDAAVGALIPYLEEFYDLNYTTVSLIFLTPFAGYSAASLCNATIHSKFGQRGIAIAAPLCHIITYVVIALHPPYPAIIVINVISGFGNGLTDACFSAWVGNMENPNSVQGLLHSCYSIGGLFAPLIATSMVVRSGWQWYTFYYIMIGLSTLEWVGLMATFWSKTGEAYRLDHPRDAEATGSRTKEALKSKVTWLCTAYLLLYMGVEVGLGGWVVTFMLRVRNASPYDAGISGTGFWTGMTVGRATLGFVTERYGERLCVSIYLAFALALQLVFWLVPQFVVSAVAVAFLGFFLGPMFPGAVMMAAKLLPKHIHVSALGFAMALGGTGGTVFPFAIGAIASARGVQVLQPIILSLIVVVAIIWLSFPRIRKRE